MWDAGYVCRICLPDKFFAVLHPVVYDFACQDAEPSPVRPVQISRSIFGMGPFSAMAASFLTCTNRTRYSVAVADRPVVAGHRIRIKAGDVDDIIQAPGRVLRIPVPDQMAQTVMDRQPFMEQTIQLLGRFGPIRTGSDPFRLIRTTRLPPRGANATASEPACSADA